MRISLVPAIILKYTCVSNFRALNATMKPHILDENPITEKFHVDRNSREILIFVTIAIFTIFLLFNIFLDDPVG